MASSMVVAALSATFVREISFACRIALILHEAGNGHLTVAQALFIPIVVALTLPGVLLV